MHRLSSAHCSGSQICQWRMEDCPTVVFFGKISALMMSLTFAVQLREWGRLLKRSTAIVLGLSLAVWNGLADDGGGAGHTVVRPVVKSLTVTNIAIFANTHLTKALEEDEIPGAVFTIVHGDQVVFQKGYGFANVQDHRPVSVRKTLFRVASISKILTAACALQLVQTHRLDLHQDVNRYLDRFRIKPAFGQPITLYNLLTHSSGFDVWRFDYGAHSAAQKLSLRDYLTQFQPARVRPPGLFSSYDNYGYTLAGYLVQKVSGMPFREYVRERLFKPLGMTHSSFAPDKSLRSRLATGYRLDGEALEPYPKDFVNITPAAGLCATAEDMTRLLIALVSNERPDGSTAFSAPVLNGLEKPHFAFDPDIPGRCYGFNLVTLAGRQALRQTGQWPGFNSLMLVFPRHHVGLFLAYNLCDQLEMGRHVSRLFVERFIPKRAAAKETTRTFNAENSILNSLPGTYVSTRFPQEAPHVENPDEIWVTPSHDGLLEIKGATYREIKPMEFERTANNTNPVSGVGQRVTFRVDGADKATHLITQAGAFRRIPWIETKRARLILTAAVSIVFLCALVWWPISALVRWLSTRIHARPTSSNNGHRTQLLPVLAKALALTVCALALWFHISLTVATFQIDPFAYFYGLPSRIKDLLRIVPILVGLTASLAACSAVAWRLRFWSLADRVFFTLVTSASLLFCYDLYCRHLWFAG